MIYRVLLVGLGRIGMGYDLRCPASLVLTHARAFTQHPRFELVGGIDPDPAQRRTFVAVYGKPAYADIAEAPSESSPDVVVLGMPTSLHAAQLTAVLQHTTPRAVLCEKPLSYDFGEARAMVAACQGRGVRMFVNYMRRSDPGALEIRDRLRDGRIRGPLKAIAWYSKGLLHNGSHFFNILAFWLGPMLEARIISNGRLWEGLDPEPDALIRFTGGDVVLVAAREEEFSYCAIELLATNGRLRYDRGGDVIAWTPRVDGVQSTGCRELSYEPQPIATGMDRYQWHVTDRLAAALDGEASEICTGAEALTTLECLHTIISKRTTS